MFLVESLVPGKTLAAWVRDQSIAYGTGGLPVAHAVSIVEQLCDLLDEVHRRALIYRDFSPNNVMIDDDLTLRLIDPELAVPAGEWAYLSHTAGYAAPEYLAARGYAPVPPRESDHFALGAVVFYLATGVNAGFAPDEPTPRPALARMSTVLYLQATTNEAVRLLGPVIEGLCADDPAERWDTEQVRRKLAEPVPTPAPGAPAPRAPAPGAGGRDTPALNQWGAEMRERLIDDGLAHLLDAIDTEHKGRLGRSTSFGATTDACNVQHGAAGLLSTLTLASQTLGESRLCYAVARVAGWTIERLENVSTVLPGLTFGRSGTAWRSDDAGRHLGDESIERTAVDLALKVPVRWANPDLFHGERPVPA